MLFQSLPSGDGKAFPFASAEPCPRKIQSDLATSLLDPHNEGNPSLTSTDMPSLLCALLSERFPFDTESPAAPRIGTVRAERAASSAD